MIIPQEIRWIGFDLNDTLHHFRHASGAAAEAVFLHIEEEFGTPVEKLRASYQEILKEAQSNHFTDPRTAQEYRTERFGKLLNKHSILTPGQVDEILDIYDRALEENLQLIDGAESALRAAKAKGYGVFVLSEGPHDAQEQTIKRLGIGRYIDVLMTSSQEGLSKSEGLFVRALERIKSNRAAVLYVGDSKERDILPAKAAGIKAIQLSSASPETRETIPSMKVLAKAVRQTRALARRTSPLDCRPT